MMLQWKKTNVLQCIIVDCSIEIKKSLKQFVFENTNSDLGLIIHPFRESMLDEIVDEDEVSTDTINVGCQVKILDCEFDEELTYKIVGSTEANSLKGKISNESPVGKALIGKKKGDVVQVETQVGVLKYKVLEIEPSATNEEVKAAYRKLAMKHHPDRVASLGDDIHKAAEEKFRQINEAKDQIYKARGIN